MTYAFGDLTVTTWGVTDDPDVRIWRARSGDKVAEFEARRDAEPTELYDLAVKALRQRPV